MTSKATLNSVTASDNLLGINRPINVLLIGAGGTGSSMLSNLFQLHSTLVRLGSQGLNVTVFDSKRVTPSNLGRQSFWSERDVGHFKANLLVSRFNQFGGLNWKAHNCNFLPDTHDNNVRGCDLLITTIDTASGRAEIGKSLESFNRPDSLWLDCGNSLETGQCIIGTMCGGDGYSTLPSPYQLYGAAWETVDESRISIPSCSTYEAIAKQSFGVNQTLATLAVSMILFPLLRKGKIDNFGFQFDLSTMETFPYPVSKDTWAIYGFFPSRNAA